MSNEEPYKGGEETITTEEQIQLEIEELKKLLLEIMGKSISKQQKDKIIKKITELIESFQDQEYDRDLILESPDGMPTEIAVLFNQQGYEKARTTLHAELEKLLQDNTISKVKIMTVLKVLLIATFFASHPDRDPTTPHPLDRLPGRLKAQVMKILFPEGTQGEWIDGGTGKEISFP